MTCFNLMKKAWRILLLLGGCSMVFQSYAQLTVTTFPPHVSGQKAVVSIGLKNGFSQDIKAARAVCFLTDVHGQMVGQSAKWVIGGREKAGLVAGGTNNFNFVFDIQRQPGTTNLLAKIVFNRVLLQDGNLADAGKDVTILPASGK